MTTIAEERGRLIEAYLPLVRRVASRFAGRGERTDDLRQVGALALVRAVDRCDPGRAELPAYLARCVEGEIRRHLRDRASVVRVPRRVLRRDGRVIPIDDASVAVDAAPDELLLDRALVASAARALDDRERRAVLLRYFCDCTQAEVGAELGLSQAHVSRLLDRALAKMRSSLGDATLTVDGDGRGQADGVTRVVA